MPISASQLADDVVSVFKKTTILTDAQIKALPTTPIELVPEPGANKLILFLRGFAHGDLEADYTNVNVQCILVVRLADGGAEESNRLRLGDSNFLNAGFAGGDPAGFFTPNVNFDTDTVIEETGYEWSFNVNKALVAEVDNSGAGNFTGGNAANTVKITVLYTIIDV